MKLLFQSFIVLFSSLFLTGCLSPVKIKSENTYLIEAAGEPPLRRTHASTLFVSAPETNTAFDTTRMAYSLYPHQLAYFAKNQWAETPSQMLLPLIATTLSRTHYFSAVVTPPYVGSYNYVLSTQIFRLQQDYSCAPVAIEFAARAQLFSVRKNRVIATKDFYIREPMQRRTPYAGVVAANRATERWLNQLANFCLRNLSK